MFGLTSLGPARTGALGLLCALSVASIRAAEAPGTVKAEVEQLIASLAVSGCEFFRNGDWHAAATASDHLRRKYEYMLDKGLLASTQDFIAQAGSGSSLSGEPYRVRCGNAPPVSSAAWLNAKLQALRGQASSKVAR